MTRCLAMLVVLVVCAWPARAQLDSACPVPNYLLFGDSPLDRLHAAVQKQKQIRAVVVGTASSSLPGKDGTSVSYPARLEEALKRRLPGVSVSVKTYAKPRQTAEQIAESLGQVLLDEKPNLVVWQTGTFDALKGVDPEHFRASVAEGVEALQAGGADVILMNMQFSPRTESMIAFGGYTDNLRWVAREREVPLFDRLAIMRNWYDNGVIDLYAATKDVSVAKRVHDCIGRALASMIVEAARLESFQGKPAQ